MSELQQNTRLYTTTFLLGFLYNFFIALHFTNNALYPLYIRHEGGGVALVGMFMGIYSIAAVLGRPVIGSLIDRYGTRTVLIIGSLSLSLPAFGYLLLLNHGLGASVWILRTIQGFGYGAHFSATFTLAAQIAPPTRRNEAVAMYGASGLAGSMAGPYLGEYLVESYSLPIFFIAMMLFGVAAAFIISRIRVPKNEDGSNQKTGSLRAALQSHDLRLLFVIAFLFAISFSTPTTFLATLAKSKSISQFSLYFTTWGFAGIMIRFIGGRWGDKVGMHRVLIPGLLLYAAGLFTIHLSYSLYGIVLAGLLCGVAHGISFPAVTSLGYSIAPKEFAGSSMALITGMMDAGTAITALVIGHAAESLGIGIVFPFASAAAFIALSLVLVYQRRFSQALTKVR